MKKLILAAMLLISASCQAQKYRLKSVSHDLSDTVVSNVVIVPYVYLPILFTPNGDGINDFWVPVTIGVENFKAEIFDLKGKLLATIRQGERWSGSGSRQIYKVKASWYDALRDQYFLAYESVLESP